MILFRKKKPKITVNNLVAVVEPSEVALEKGLSDRFNKIIKIHEGVRVDKNKITWGRIIEERNFSEEEVYCLEKIKKIPVVERKFRKPEFFEEPDFGGIIN